MTDGLRVSVTLTGVGKALIDCEELDGGGGICSNVVLLLVGVGDDMVPRGEFGRVELDSSSVMPLILAFAVDGGPRGIGMEILTDDTSGGGGGGV